MKNIKYLLVFIIFLTSIQAFSQNSNELRAYYGFTHCKAISEEVMPGSGSYVYEDHFEFGFRYLKKIKKNLNIELGLNYLKLGRPRTYIDIIAGGYNPEYKKLDIVSIPIYVNYTLWKNIFVNGGPIVDFQNADDNYDPQAGIGYSIGIGGKYYFNDFLIFVNPNFKRHSVISSKEYIGKRNLREFGVQFGFGYKF